MSKINKALAVLAVLAFFLPFATISCNNKVLVEVKGVKLAQCAIQTCSAKDIFTTDLKSLGMNLPDMDVPNPASDINAPKLEGQNFVLFAAIAALVAVILLFLPGRGGELLSGVASVAVIVLLFLFRSKFSDAVTPHLNSPEMKFASGFWGAMLLSAGSAILAFKGTAATRSPARAGAAGASGGFAPQPPAGA